MIQTLPLQITTNSNLFSGFQGQAYSTQIVAADGAPPYSFAVTDGVLPIGTTLSTGGLLSGTPTQYGTFSFTVTATDSAGGTASKIFQLFIEPRPLLILTGQFLPAVNENVFYSQQISVVGGAPQYSFAVTGGSLPGGLSLSSTGLISGVPVQPGAFSFEISVTDSFGTVARSTFSLNVFPLLRIISNPDLPKGITNQFYSRQIGAIGGISPYVYTLVGGSLPNGFSLSPTGVVGGISTEPGTFTFIVQASDTQGFLVQQSFRLTISDLYIVTTAEDTNDGVCDSHCSLREAVAVGDSIPGSSNVIEFSDFFDSQQFIALTSSILIKKTTEIRGKGTWQTNILAVGNRQTKFRISGTGDVTFRNLRIGLVLNAFRTGAIDNESSGLLTIDTCIFGDNEKFFSPQNPGGAAILQTAGNLVVDRSTFSNNYVWYDPSICGGKGGAIYFSGAVARITNSTFSSNQAPNGTAIFGNGSTSIENSTFTNNFPRWDGCIAPAYATILNETGSICHIQFNYFQEF